MNNCPFLCIEQSSKRTISKANPLLNSSLYLYPAKYRTHQNPTQIKTKDIFIQIMPIRSIGSFLYGRLTQSLLLTIGDFRLSCLQNHLRKAVSGMEDGHGKNCDGDHAAYRE